MKFQNRKRTFKILEIATKCFAVLGTNFEININVDTSHIEQKGQLLLNSLEVIRSNKCSDEIVLKSQVNRCFGPTKFIIGY